MFAFILKNMCNQAVHWNSAIGTVSPQLGMPEQVIQIYLYLPLLNIVSPEAAPTPMTGEEWIRNTSLS